MCERESPAGEIEVTEAMRKAGASALKGYELPDGPADEWEQAATECYLEMVRVAHRTILSK